MLEQDREKEEARAMVADFDKAASILQRIGEMQKGSEAADIIQLIVEVHGADRLVERLVEKGGFKDLRTTPDNLWPLHNVWEHLGAVDTERFISALKESFVIGWLPLFAGKISDLSSERVLDLCLRNSPSYATFDYLLQSTSLGLSLTKDQQQELVDVAFEKNVKEMRKNSRPHLLSCWLFNLKELDTEALAFKLVEDYGEAEFVRLYRNKDTGNSLPLTRQGEFVDRLFENGLGDLVFSNRAKFSKVSDQQIADTAIKHTALPEGIKYRDTGVVALVKRGLSVLQGLSEAHAENLIGLGYVDEVCKAFQHFSPEGQLYLVGRMKGFDSNQLRTALSGVDRIPLQVWRKVFDVDSAEIALEYTAKVDGDLDLAVIVQNLFERNMPFLVAEHLEIFSPFLEENKLMEALVPDPLRNWEEQSAGSFWNWLSRNEKFPLKSNVSALIRNSDKFSKPAEIQEVALQVAQRHGFEYLICTLLHHVSEPLRSVLEKNIVDEVKSKNASTEVIKGVLNNIAHFNDLDQNELIAYALEARLDRLEIWNNLKHMRNLTDATLALAVRYDGYYSALAHPEVFIDGTEEKVVQAMLTYARSDDGVRMKRHFEAVLRDRKERLGEPARKILDEYFLR